MGREREGRRLFHIGWKVIDRDAPTVSHALVTMSICYKQFSFFHPCSPQPDMERGVKPRSSPSSPLTNSRNPIRRSFSTAVTQGPTTPCNTSMATSGLLHRSAPLTRGRWLPSTSTNTSPAFMMPSLAGLLADHYWTTVVRKVGMGSLVGGKAGWWVFKCAKEAARSTQTGTCTCHPTVRQVTESASYMWCFMGLSWEGKWQHYSPLLMKNGCLLDW